MPKFILIDQSIKDAGGHHLEYALRVLAAAKKRGYFTVLAVSNNCVDFSDLNIDRVMKSFRFTFWENLGQISGSFDVDPLTVWGRGLRGRLRLIRDVIRSSVAARYYYLGRTGSGLGATMSDLAREGRWFGARWLALMLFAVGFAANRSHVVRRLIRMAFRALVNIAKIALAVLGVIALPFVAAVGAVAVTRSARPQEDHVTVFAEDVARLLRESSAEAGDVIFVPTLSATELVGVARCPRPLIEGLNWHFLFRRDIFSGREPSYPSQSNSPAVQAALRGVFEYRRLMGATQLGRFYTDTEQLTEQYSKLGVVDFETLPIPIDSRFRRTKADGSRPLRVVYVGDAREEKGFHLLPRLIDDLWATGLGPEDLQFVIQSNFNVPLGEPRCRVAKAELAGDARGWVTLREGPFSSDEYVDLVNSADILVTPYEGASYYARSSGIFAEAIAAGTPVATTDKSWMAKQMVANNDTHLSALAAKGERLQSRTFVDGDPVDLITVRPITAKSDVWLLLELELVSPQPGNYIDVTWESEPTTIVAAATGLWRRKWSLDLQSPVARCLLHLPNRSSLRVKLSTDASPSFDLVVGPEVTRMTVTELLCEEGATSSAGAVLFDAEADFGDAVHELVTNFETYAGQMSDLSKPWRTFHSPERLVEILEGNASR